MNFGSPLQQAFQTRVVTLVDSSFYKIQEAFIDACKSYSRVESFQELIRFYYSKEMSHTCKAAERIILDFCIFVLTNFKVLPPESFGILDHDFDGLCLRFLCLCFFESERFFDLNFPKISPAEKYFIGSLISHDEGQRQLMIMDNTPRKFASEGDVDYYNLYILWLIRSTKNVSMPDILKHLMLMIERELRQKTQRMIKLEALTRRQKINPEDLKLQELTSDYASTSYSESSCPSIADDRQGSTSSENVSMNWDNYDPQQLLDNLFKDHSLRHDEMDFLKVYFEKSFNYGILTNITITDAAMTHVALEYPHLCGAILAFLIASKDPRAFRFFNGPICETEAVQFVVIIRTFVECWNRNIAMGKEFVGNAVTACLNYLNNAIASKAHNSDDSRCIRLIMTYINILVAYAPDTVADRFEEMLNILPNFNHMASANTAYNRIISHRARLNHRVL